MAHHLFDPERLRQLTQGPDTGQPRLWDYNSEPSENDFIEQPTFWRGSGMRNGSLLQVYGTGKLAINIMVLTSQGLRRSGLDVFLDRIQRDSDSVPIPSPEFDEEVQNAICNLLCRG